jgi:hypothetical protein
VQVKQLEKFPRKLQPKLRSTRGTQQWRNDRENIFAGTTTQQLSIIVRFFSVFLVQMWPRSYAILRVSRKSAFHFLFRCQNRSEIECKFCQFKCFPRTFLELAIFRISVRPVRAALTTIKLAILIATHYFYCYMQAYIAFMLLLLRHTCITFLLIGRSVKRNVHFIALPPPPHLD